MAKREIVLTRALYPKHSILSGRLGGFKNEELGLSYCASGVMDYFDFPPLKEKAILVLSSRRSPESYRIRISRYNYHDALHYWDGVSWEFLTYPTDVSEVSLLKRFIKQHCPRGYAYISLEIEE